MAPNKQKVVRSGRKLGRPPRPQPATFAPSPVPSPAPKSLKLKVTFKRGETGQPDERDAPAYQFPLSAPPSDDPPVKDDSYGSTATVADSQNRRRGARQRKAPQRDDVVYGSEMDNLIASSATIAQAEDDDNVGMTSSPPAVISLRTPEGYDSPPTVQGQDSPPPRFDRPVSQDVYDILKTLRSSPEIQVDLPNMFASSGSDVGKPYTAAFLTELYIQCYENGLWHFCDLVADTWIRALQHANKRSHKSKDKRCHLWRQNVPLERKFAEKKLGFKKQVVDLGLDVEDPEMDRDVATFDPERLRDLYTHTRHKCGARLLWADAMALAGRKMESDIIKRPDAWPKELFYDVMCTSLRLVGRKLTLKIEEKYEGAWCRYHEHVRHGLPCYRELAYQQNVVKGDAEEMAGRKGTKKRKHAQVGGDEQESKRVRFDAGDVKVIDFSDIDAEGESEED